MDKKFSLSESLLNPVPAYLSIILFCPLGVHCPLSSLPGLGGVFKTNLFEINKFLTDFFSLRSTTIVAKSYNHS